jgi:sugar phosphate isomerase/epimerase
MRWIERLGTKIGYVHLHDNHGIEDEHLGFGQGTIPLDDVCRALDELAPDAIWTIETQPEWLEFSLAWLGQRGFLKQHPGA